MAVISVCCNDDRTAAKTLRLCAVTPYSSEEKNVKGFKDFLMQGNIVSLAVAVIIGTAFGAVVKAFTAIILDIIGKIFGTPNFSSASIAGISLGDFLTALVTFFLVALVVYFMIVKPMAAIEARNKTEEEPAPTQEELLTEIRDLLAQQRVPQAPPVPVPSK